MASIDKQSIRAEFDKIKVNFDEQVKSGKVSSEVATLVNTLMMLFNIILSVFMEKNTKKTSSNSSIPPSQTTPDESSTTNKNKRKPNDQDNTEKEITVSGNTRTIESVTLLPVTTCNSCGEDLTNTPCTHIEHRTKIDIVFEKTEEHVDVEIKNNANPVKQPLKQSFLSTCRVFCNTAMVLKPMLSNSLSLKWLH